MKPVLVKCYSGRAYADRPVSFMLNGVRYSVESVEKEWWEPGVKHFRVRTGDNKRAELCYNGQNCAWSVSDLGGKELG